jgi:uncharacterized protein
MMPASTEPVHIAVFARAPVAGAAKTRLIPAIGAPAAARLHRKLVLQTLKTACAAKLGPVTLWTAPDTTHRFFRALMKQGVICRNQSGSDLGARMQHALSANRPAPTLLIGSDCASLTASHLIAAADVLRAGHDAVFLPAEDGGYVLIGLNAEASSALFENVPWGSPEVMRITRLRLAQLGYSWQEPATLWDIDHPSDLKRWNDTSRNFV